MTGQTGYAVALGLATAVDTLCSQAYGARSWMMIGLTAQRTAVIMIVTSIPIYIVWWNCSRLLILLRQDPVISEDAGQYVWRLAPSLLPYLWFEVMKKYLIAQRVVRAQPHSPAPTLRHTRPLPALTPRVCVALTLR